MPCFYPMPAFRSPRCLHPVSGKQVLFFDESKVVQWPGYESLKVPCGSCKGCLLERSRQWAVRCMHESSLYSENCFITLTFDPENLDYQGSLRKRDFQLFMKRLRKRFSPRTIRFFHCGEYGERYGRPHHHACLFNFDFPDKVLSRVSESGSRCYTSAELLALWPYGRHEIGDVTFESSAYVARYVLKKVNGVHADDHYTRFDDFGNPCRIESEYVTMSRRPGIARGWIDDFKSDVFPGDFVVIRDGVKCRPPVYYSRVFELTNPEAYASIKLSRIERAKVAPLSDPSRLKAREIIVNQRSSLLQRSLHNET